jgi:hypothetical protein
VVNVTAPGVCPVLFHLRIPRPGGALLPPLAGQEQDTLAPEAWLVSKAGLGKQAEEHGKGRLIGELVQNALDEPGVTQIVFPAGVRS